MPNVGFFQAKNGCRAQSDALASRLVAGTMQRNPTASYYALNDRGNITVYRVSGGSSPTPGAFPIGDPRAYILSIPQCAQPGTGLPAASLAAGATQIASMKSAIAPKPKPVAPVAAGPGGQVFLGRTRVVNAKAQQAAATKSAAAAVKGGNVSKLAKAQVAQMGTANLFGIGLGDVIGLGKRIFGGGSSNRSTANVPGPAGLPCVPGTPGCGGSRMPVVPTPGIGGAVQRLLPGGATGFEVAHSPGTMLACPPGFHPNKSNYYTRSGFVPKGSKCVKNRKRNPLNHRALTKATSRIAAYARTQSRAEKAIKKAARNFR